MQKILLSLFFIASLSFAEAQTNGLMLQASFGLMGDRNNQQPTYSSFETRYSFKSTISWTAGLAYQRFFSKGLGIKARLLYEYAPVTRFENYQYRNFRDVFYNGEISRQFSNQYLVLPLQLHWQGKKIGFSAGIITNFHLKTKLEQEQVFFESSEEIGRTQRSFQSGDYFSQDWGDTEKIYLEDKFSFQIAFGLHIPLGQKFLLNVEYKDFIKQNLLVREATNYDVIGTYVDTFDPFARSITMGISWIIL